jgi:microfibrillar-associated protein 1
MASKKKGGAFGRDEMNLLLGVAGGDEAKAGIGTAGIALLQSRGFTTTDTKKKSSKEGIIDYAALSTAETAALIQKEQLSKGLHAAAGSTSRLRAQRTSNKKRLAHHEFLEQELLVQQKQQQQQQQQQQVAPVPNSDDDEVAEFATASHNKKKGHSNNKRIQLEPQIIVASQKHDASQRQRRRRSSSSDDSDSDTDNIRQRRRRAREDSSSGESTANRRRRRRRQSTTSSSSSSDEDEARQRRIRKRQQLEAHTKQQESKGNETIIKSDLKATEEPTADERMNESPRIPTDKLRTSQPSKRGDSTAASKQRKRQEDSSSSSTSASSSSSEDGSSSDSDSSSSEDEPAPLMAKPLFVPKRKRLHLEQEKLETERALKEQEEAAKKQEQQRKMQSRALVAQVVSTVGPGAADDGNVSEDEEGLALRMLDDKDDVDPDTERDLWEVRELGRLLEEIDRLRKKEQEEAEYRRRQQLTDKQAQAEDEASGRYQQPGMNRMLPQDGIKDQPKYLQKYFHRGAYYMDEDEMDEDDVRRRAKEYERGVTESAKSRGDIRKLPQIMQVKQFGRASQSKYQGLTKEDTSNKESSTLLPLVHHQKQRKNTDVHRHRK